VKLREFLRILSSSTGFSLTEIMVGGAVLAGVALAGAQLLKNQKFSQRRVEHDQSLSLFHSNLLKSMNLTSNCNATMKAILPSSTSALAATSVSTLYMCVPGSPAGNKCADDNASADQSFDAYTPGAYQGTTLLSNGQFIDNTRVWQVSGMQILDARTTTGTSRLRITYSMNNRVGKKTISKDIFLNLRFTAAGHFKECINNQESNINNLQNDLCKSLNLSEGTSTSDGRLAVWDEVTQTCRVVGSKDCSTQYNMSVDGIGADGVARCRPIVTPSDASDLGSPVQTSGSCPTGQKPQMYWDGATKKMVMRCAP
jgi:hypothetical protein